LHALWAAWNCELLTPSCCRGIFGIEPLLAGSGKARTPWERMHREKASAVLTCAVVPVVDGVDEPPQPAASSTSPRIPRARTSHEV
jgi:hypothetical protein